MFRFFHIATYFTFIVLLLFFSVVGEVYAACTLPDGVEGEVIYNRKWKVMQYCDNENWIGMGLIGGSGFVKVGSTMSGCDYTLEGALRYNQNTKTIEFCDGSSWSTFYSQSTGPAPIIFNNQSNVPPANEVVSNEVTLTGFSGSLEASCVNCTAIARNGDWGGTVMAGFVLGDKIAIRQMAPSGLGVAGTATVSVGATTSAAWTVTTSSQSANPFSFQNVNGAATDALVLSNEVTLSGFTGSLTAICGDCLGIARNNEWGTQVLSGFVAGDKIRIRLLTSSASLSTQTASVTVGNTVSGVWQVTTAGGTCVAGMVPGDACPDGSIFVGFSPDGVVPMYTTACDAGQNISGGACTGAREAIAWGPIGVDTMYRSTITGRSNTEGLLMLGREDYLAAKYCDELTANGHNDWYLPSRDEQSLLYNHYLAIGGFDIPPSGDGSYYWSSSENNNNNAWVRRFSDGNQNGINKHYLRFVRCVRR